jgi:hypothetical protein
LPATLIDDWGLQDLDSGARNGATWVIRYE